VPTSAREKRVPRGAQAGGDLAVGGAMEIRTLRRVVGGLALVAIPATVGWTGGWAVVTVKEVPDQVVVGKPVTLTWVVRQHGVQKLSGLDGRVEASAGLLKSNVNADARPTGREGEYTATLTLPTTGDWKVSVHSGFGSSKAVVEMMAVDAKASAAVIADADRGKRLFAAKGCVTCHVDIKVGPSLEGKRYEASRLTAFLSNPTKGFWGNTGNTNTMPNLELQPKEISALVAYVNGERVVGAR
jgi:cytochrome c551/c552